MLDHRLYFFFLFVIATKTISVIHIIKMLIVDTAISVSSFQPIGHLIHINRPCAVHMHCFTIQKNHRR